MIEKDQIKRVLKVLKRHEERVSIVLGGGVLLVVLLSLVWYIKNTQASQSFPRLPENDLVQPSQVALPEDLFNSPIASSTASPLSTATPLASPKEMDTPTSIQTQPVNIYTVQPGEGLWQIAERFYGDGREYIKIFNANRNVMKDPEDIRVGMKLRIP